MVTRLKDTPHRVVNFLLPEADYEALRLQCFLSRLPMAEFVRQAVTERLAKVQHKNGGQEPQQLEQERAG